MSEEKLKGRILYIDDEVESCCTMIKFFEPRGFSVIVSFTAENGYEMLKLWRPDIVLIDIKLIGMSGIDFIERIQLEGVKTPSIVITGYPERMAEIEIKKLKIRGYYIKPYSMADLYRTVTGVLGVNK